MDAVLPFRYEVIGTSGRDNEHNVCVIYDAEGISVCQLLEPEAAFISTSRKYHVQ